MYPAVADPDEYQHPIVSKRGCARDSHFDRLPIGVEQYAQAVINPTVSSQIVAQNLRECMGRRMQTGQ